MASNDGNPRRDRDRPEDNPFIAFRRFADSSVSSLLNSVFTLPSTLAQWNNAHQAREQCLFKRGDPEQCAKLAELERKIGKTREEGHELYRVGDLQAVLEKGEELLKLDVEANEVRKHIVQQNDTDMSLPPHEQSHGAKPSDLLEKVANRKGQEWAWSWDWGFPRPFDAQDNQKSDEDTDRYRGRCRRWRRQREENLEGLQDYQEQLESLQKRNMQRADGEGPSFRVGDRYYPPGTDLSHRRDQSSMQPDPFAEILSMIISMAQQAAPFSFIFESNDYSPGALENDEALRKSGVAWRDAFEDLIRAEQGRSLMPEEHVGQSKHLPYHLWARKFRDPDFIASGTAPQALPWDGEEKNDEPSYEYSHDHEDQHDEPPTMKTKQGEFADVPATELEAYERLLGPASAPMEPPDVGQSSILSTLTTTERTVAADGSVTTKIVLKKRFADGREESSETVHTQRGHDAEPTQDPWKAMQEAQFPTQKYDAPPKAESERKRGWFWSN